MSDLATQFGISRQRIHQIIRRLGGADADTVRIVRRELRDEQQGALVKAFLDRYHILIADLAASGLTVPGMTEPPRRYDVTVTVDRDGGHPPNLAEFAMAAERAALARAACIVSAHTASQIVSIVTVLAADQPAAVAVVSDALKHPIASSIC